jgi:hypothetical protein
MKVIKFDPNNKPEFVRQDFLLDDRATNTQIIGYWIIIGKNEDDVLIESGDYIIRDNNINEVVKLADYNLSSATKQYVRDKIGRAVIEELFKTLIDQNLSQADEADITNRLLSTVVALMLGNLRGARTLANNTATGGALTAQRKTFVLNTIDAAILLL